MELKLKSINFRYEDDCIFENFNLDFKSGLTFLLGVNNSGKTTLFNVVSGIFPYDGEISLDNKDIRLCRDKCFLNKTYVDSLSGKVSKYLSGIDLDSNDFLDTSKYVDCKFDEIDYSIKIKICLANIFYNNYKVIFIDNLLCWLSKNDKNMVLKKLKSISKNKIVVVITNNIEDVLYSKNVVLLDNGKVVINDDLKGFFCDKRRLEKYKVDLPFVIDLSYNLKLYDIIDDIYFDTRKLVDAIWK